MKVPWFKAAKGELIIQFEQVTAGHGPALSKSMCPGRNNIYPPPNLGQNAFLGGGGKAPRVRIFIPPPLFQMPPQEGIFSAGGWGCIKFGPPMFLLRACNLKRAATKDPLQGCISGAADLRKGHLPCHGYILHNVEPHIPEYSIVGA